MTTEEIMNNLNLENTQRFSSAPWFSEISKLSVAVIGLGGIGSYATYALSRFRPASMYIIDMDTVEAVNMAGQLYRHDDIGLFKTQAMAYTINKFSEYTVNTQSARIQDCVDNLSTCDIIVCGFDNMEARRFVFDTIRYSDRRRLFIDGRMSAEFYQLLCVDTNNMTSKVKYAENWLFYDSEAEPTVCSYKQTSFVGMQIGGMIGSLVANYANNLNADCIERPVPFLTEFNSAGMYFNIED